MDNPDELITVTLTREQWYNITGALWHDTFENRFHAEYDIIWSAAFPNG